MEFVEEHPRVQEARREFRRIQMDFGRTIAPAVSVRVGAQWEELLGRDPEGHQALNFVRDLRERLTPMAQ